MESFANSTFRSTTRIFVIVTYLCLVEMMHFETYNRLYKENPMKYSIVFISFYLINKKAAYFQLLYGFCYTNMANNTLQMLGCAKVGKVVMNSENVYT